MNTELQNRCELFVDNRDAIRNAYPWQSDYMALAGSAVFTSLGKRVDVNRMKEVERIFKENTGILSDFRSNVKIPVLCKMALADDPAEYLAESNRIYKALNKGKLLGSEYRIMAAMTICDHVAKEEREACAERTSEIYAMMKSQHPWLTSDEDMPFAAMLAATGQNPDSLLTEMEACYAMSKDTFYDANARQTLSHVMALDPKPAAVKCEKAAAIWKELKARKSRFGSGVEIAVLATLCSLDLSVEQIVTEIIEADENLKKHRGFGFWTMTATNRRMYAALLVVNAHESGSDHAESAALASSLALAIELEVCMMIMMTTMMTTASSTSH